MAADLRGAFAALTTSAAQAAAQTAAAQATGAFGLPQELNPYAPGPTPAQHSNSGKVNVAPEDAQPMPMPSFWSRYRNLILIGAAVLLGGYFLLKRKR